MQTQCPTCQTLFRVTTAQLDAAGGRVRCGHCHGIFNARDHATATPSVAPSPHHDTLSEQDIDHLLSSDTEDDEFWGSDWADADDLEPIADFSLTPDFGDEVPETPPPPITTPPPTVLSVQPVAEPAPRPLSTTTNHLATGLWSLLSILLLIGLLLQYARIDRERLAAVPSLRPALEQLCRLSGCTLAPRRAPSRIEVVNRDVRFHPDYQSSLLVSAAFRNDAPFEQPYPNVELVLQNTGGQTVASRLFHPAEYLGPEHPQMLAAGGRANLQLELLDPGLRAVSFQLYFR